MLTVIVPHGRREFSANLLANFRRQRGIEAQLLIVANGPAAASSLLAKRSSSDEAPDTVSLGGSRRCGVTSPITEITSGAHQSDAMNAGLAWLRANGGGAWARFDDDDYYGPGYLAAVEASLRGGGLVVSGMPWRFVMLDDGLHRFQGTGEFTGGTHACNTADVALFPRKDGEDLDWCAIMRGHGARLVQREPWGYCYDRTTRAARRCIWGGPLVTRRAFGPSLFYGPHAMTAVDYPGLEPLYARPIPSDEEVATEFLAS